MRQTLEVDDEEGGRVKTRQRSSSLDDYILKLLRTDAEELLSENEPELFATVLSVNKHRVWINFQGVESEVRLTTELQLKQQTEIAVGDHVVLERRAEHQFVTRVLRRKTKLSRPDPGGANHERVIVANVDLVVVTVSVSAPPLHPRIIDRYLIAIQKGGARPVIVLNKADLITSDADWELLRPYREQGVPVISVSAEQGMGMAELRSALQGTTSAFVGHSGVGKSSLVRALIPGLDVLIGGVSDGNLRGTHTTRRSTLYALDATSQLIDTPGIREFGLWQLGKEELAWHFPEFQGLACKFRDCTHSHEPGCAVRDAVEAGTVSRHRFETFLRLLESL